MFKHFGLDSTRHREEQRQSSGLLGEAVSGQLSRFQVVMCVTRENTWKSLCVDTCILEISSGMTTTRLLHRVV